MGCYKLSPEAEDDLNRIWLRGVRDFGEAQTDTYYYDFIVRFEQIAETPKLYPVVDELRQGYRRSVWCR